MRHKKPSIFAITRIAPPYSTFFALFLLLPWGGRVQGQASNTQEITRPLTIGDNLPVMFRRGDGHHDGWILKLKAPDQTIAVVGPPDSTGWSLNVGGSGNTVTISETCAERNYAKFTWFGSPDGEALFHTRIEGTIRPCPGPGGGGGGGGQPPPFNIDILDGLVFLVERESETVIGGSVRIAAYRREGSHYGDEDRIPVEVKWSCLDGNLVFHEVLTDAEGKKTPGNPLDSENMRQHEVFVTSPIEKTYEVLAAVDPGENEYGAAVPGYNLKAYVSFHDISLAVDMNRDGKITPADRALNSAATPWRFWYNDDRDFKGEGVVSEYNEPGQSPSNADFFKYYNKGNTVQPPVRDFTDMYPLLVHVKNHFTKMKQTGEEDLYAYRITFVGPNNEFPYHLAPNFFAIFSEINASNSNSYLTDLSAAEKIANISITDAYRSRAKDTLLFSNHQRENGIVGKFVTQLLDGDGGILLMQHFPDLGSRIQGKLTLDVVNQSNQVVLSSELHISLSEVEDMFAHLDLTGSVKQGDYTTQNRYLDSEPVNYPDNLTSDTRFIYVHGYNNNMIASRGSNAENFKRLHLLGSRAKYIAVSWYGWESQESIPDVLFPLIGQKCPDYQVNVNNAFQTAPFLFQKLSAANLHKDETYVMAHSLGNMLVSAAIEDADSVNIKKYFMINAAVPSESYSMNNIADVEMTHNTWSDEWQHVNKSYEGRLFNYAWSVLFDQEEDYRSLISWHGRFASVPEKVDVFSFWSKGDSTFWGIPKETPPMPIPPAEFLLWGRISQISWIYDTYGPILQGRNAWARQEKLKGWGAAGYSSFGGWSYNPYWQDVNKPLIFGIGVTDITAGTNPYWGISGAFPARYHQPANSFPAVLIDPEIAEKAEFRNAMLSYAVTARRITVGGTGDVPGLGDGNIIELESLQGGTHWPKNRYEDADSNKFFWDHGDFQTIALPYVLNFYKRILNEIN